MFDETKLWYSVRGFGFREFSTLAVHGQVTWADDAGLHDEDVFFLPAESTGEIFGRIAVECFADGWASWNPPQTRGGATGKVSRNHMLA